MSVGTVPILNYADYVYPPLQDGKNCLTFSTKEELVEKVREALSMSEKDFTKMHSNVLEFYECHLKPSSFGNMILKSNGYDRTIYVCSSNLSV
jgi:hypothetical protein